MESLFETKGNLVENKKKREISVEDLWEILDVHRNISNGILKIEYEGEIFFGQFMQMDNAFNLYPNDPINAERIHLKIGGIREMSFPFSVCNITILDEVEIAKLLNLGFGKIGEATMDSKYGIVKGSLDEDWYEKNK